MKIVLCHKDTAPVGAHGGFSALYKNIAREFVAMGHQVAVITAFDGEWMPGVERIIVPDMDPSERRRAVSSALDALKPDVVECPSWGAEVALYVSRPRSKRAPVVIRADIPSRMYPEALSCLVEEEMVAQADAVIAVSNWCARQWAWVDNRCLRVVPHGARREPGEDGKEKGLVVWVGKATWMKGIDLLADVACSLQSRHRLVCVIGPSRYSLDGPLNMLKLTGAEVVSQLPEDEYFALLRRAQFILSTSRKEGFGLALLEGMAHGAVPVVPVWIGGPLDYITPANAVIYQRIGGVLEALASAGDVEQLSKRAQERADRFSWARTAVETLAVYREVAGGWL